jgi:hypothetical protein
VLKAKYAEAKELGEAVNVSRNRMSTPPPGAHAHAHTCTSTYTRTHTRSRPPAAPHGFSLPTVGCLLTSCTLEALAVRPRSRRSPLTAHRGQQPLAPSHARDGLDARRAAQMRCGVNSHRTARAVGPCRGRRAEGAHRTAASRARDAGPVRSVRPLARRSPPPPHHTAAISSPSLPFPSPPPPLPSPPLPLRLPFPPLPSPSFPSLSLPFAPNTLLDALLPRGKPANLPCSLCSRSARGWRWPAASVGTGLAGEERRGGAGPGGGGRQGRHREAKETRRPPFRPTRRRAHTRTHTHPRTHARAPTHTHVHTHKQSHTYARTHTRARAHTLTHTHTCRTHVHAHTHTQANTPSGASMASFTGGVSRAAPV